MTQQYSSTVIVDSSRVLDAWNWFRSEINERPVSAGRVCTYDLKRWGRGGAVQPLIPCDIHVRVLATLYLLSQLHRDFRPVFQLVTNGAASDIAIRTPIIETDIKRLISDATRFRWALSEHLAFWVSLAVTSKMPGIGQHIRSLPNLFPEDKGADGVSATIPLNSGVIDVIEYHSVKNSTGDPSNLVATDTFRNRGEVSSSRRKLFDEFWCFVHENLGFSRLDELLDGICARLQQSANDEIRSALLAQCRFNATIVANDVFADARLFDGYQFIVADSSRCVATYIGSSDWVAFAEEVQSEVQRLLCAAGVWST